MNLNVQNPARVTLSCVPHGRVPPLRHPRVYSSLAGPSIQPSCPVSNFPSLRFSVIPGLNATYIQPFLCSY